MRNNRDVHMATFGATLQPNGSYIDRDGDTSWYNEEGDFHRLDGPAVIHASGSVRWWINGKHFKSVKIWLKYTNHTDEQKLLLRLQYD
jgi:hypothetical protein